MSKKKTPKNQKTWPQTISSYLSIAREENNIIRGSEMVKRDLLQISVSNTFTIIFN